MAVDRTEGHVDVLMAPKSSAEKQQRADELVAEIRSADRVRPAQAVAAELKSLKIFAYTDDQMEIFKVAEIERLHQEEQSTCQAITDGVNQVCQEALLEKPLVEMTKEERNEKLKNFSFAKAFYSGECGPSNSENPIAGIQGTLGVADIVRKYSSDEATKHDEDKIRYDLVPTRAYVEVARVFTHGAKKYGDHNWRKGTKYSRFIRAAKGHITDFELNHLIDQDSNTYVLANAIASLMILLEYQLMGLGTDDRIKESL